ncbi:MAG: hypothetical protein COR54_19505 [Elusimicrobia bacterium CG22_combo_CG10-13_8_21_14_all_63_91]|nr:MAG: hypothetical protein COR54_19505 [Elusimicrobia bacterium CG22_combo_CG10-13_8_21_14_all_63_91]
MIFLFSGFGCTSTAPLTRFRLGMYGVSSPAQLVRLKGFGFNSFFTRDKNPAFLSILAREAKRQKMDMVVYPEGVISSTFSAAAKSWPIAAWYLVDEPDGTNKLWPAEKLAALDAANKKWSPNQRTTFVIGQGSPALKYGKISDILMVDWYPVPHLPLESVAQQLDIARQGVPAGKPIWAVLQSFNWKDYPQRNPRKPRIGRFPYHEEIRFMSYAAIVHGARGIYYLTLRRPDGEPRTLFDFPEHLSRVTRVAGELKSLLPILDNGTPIPVPFPLADGLEAAAWRYRFRDYVIVLNRSKMFSIPFPEALLDRRWRPLFETRRDTKELLLEKDGVFHLRSYDVMVFESRFSLRRTPAK